MHPCPQYAYTHAAIGKCVFIFTFSPLKTSDHYRGILNQVNAMFDTINKPNANNRGNLRKLDSALLFPKYLESQICLCISEEK